MNNINKMNSIVQCLTLHIIMVISRNIQLLILFTIGTAIWLMPTPEGISLKSWHVFIIFLMTIMGIIANPIPMGAIALLSIAFAVLTKTLTLSECLSGFSADIVWLVVFAFFISLGFIKTGLGLRIAYYFISKIGRSTLGLAYGLVFSEFILAPLIPSVTARGGGIIFPIAQSLTKSYIDEEHKGVSSRNGGFIMQICLQSNVITSALFLTAMAANPLIVKIAQGFGVEITWFDWALAASVPGVINLLLMPLLLYYIYPPAIKHSETAPQIARESLQNMGPMSLHEKLMSLTFVFLITSWIFGPSIGINATTTALLGCCLLLIFKVITFDDCIGDKAAWHTFIWYATLVMLSTFLSQEGMMSWMGGQLKQLFIGVNPFYSILFLSIFYFYIHYFFASITAHITVLFPIFFAVFISVGIPLKIAALSLGFMSILSGGLTHFGISSAPIYFGAGYMKTKTWWSIGLIISILNIAVWVIFGAIWWKVIGLW